MVKAESTQENLLLLVATSAVAIWLCVEVSIHSAAYPFDCDTYEVVHNQRRMGLGCRIVGHKLGRLYQIRIRCGNCRDRSYGCILLRYNLVSLANRKEAR